MTNGTFSILTVCVMSVWLSFVRQSHSWTDIITTQKPYHSIGLVSSDKVPWLNIEGSLSTGTINTRRWDMKHCDFSSMCGYISETIQNTYLVIGHW